MPATQLVLGRCCLLHCLLYTVDKAAANVGAAQYTEQHIQGVCQPRDQRPFSKAARKPYWYIKEL
jgi:hypothetical protein